MNDIISVITERIGFDCSHVDCDFYKTHVFFGFTNVFKWHFGYFLIYETEICQKEIWTELWGQKILT